MAEIRMSCGCGATLDMKDANDIDVGARPCQILDVGRISAVANDSTAFWLVNYSSTTGAAQ